MIEVAKNLCHAPKTFREASSVAADFSSKAPSGHFCQRVSALNVERNDVVR